MKIEFHPDVFKQLRALPLQDFRPVLRQILDLAQQPRPVGVKKLVGSDDAWRIRVGNYRVVYLVDDRADLVTIMRVGHRRDVYG